MSNPEIRNRKYSHSAVSKPLHELGMTYTGLSGKVKEDFGHGDAHFITYMNVYKNAISAPDMVERIEIDNTQNKVEKGDIFFTTSSETPEEVGMSSVWKYDVDNLYLNSFCFGYRLFNKEKFDLDYLAYLFRSNEFRKNIQLLAQGISRYNISKTKCMDINLVYTPNILEQSFIGKFLVNIESIIENKKLELNKVNNYKKTMLYKMFPQKEKKVPEIRFKKYSGDYKTYHFKKCFQLSQGLQIPISSRLTRPAEDSYFYITNEFLKSDSSIKYYIYKPNQSVICKKDDVLMTRTGNTGIAITNVEGCFHNNFFKIDYDRKKFYNLYLLYLFQTSRMYNEIMSRAGASTIPDLKHKEFYDIRWELPLYDEQLEIGNFFYELDLLISSKEKEIDTLKYLKDTLISKVF